MTRRVRPARRSACPQSGQATVEFALVLPLVIFLILAVLQTALVVRDYVATVHAAREAVRAASVDRRPGRRGRRRAHGCSDARTSTSAPALRSAGRSAWRSPTPRTPTCRWSGVLFPDPELHAVRHDADRAMRRSERGGVAIFGLVARRARRPRARGARSGRRGRGALGAGRHRGRCRRARRGRRAGPATTGRRRGARRGAPVPPPTTAACSSGATAPTTTPRSWCASATPGAGPGPRSTAVRRSAPAAERRRAAPDRGAAGATVRRCAGPDMRARASSPRSLSWPAAAGAGVRSRTASATARSSRRPCAGTRTSRRSRRRTATSTAPTSRARTSPAPTCGSVSLRDAKLVKTILNGADLTGADLRDADLTGASLINATLDHADLTDTDQTGITFCNTVMPDGTVTDCKFLQSNRAGEAGPAAADPRGAGPPAGAVHRRRHRRRHRGRLPHAARAERGVLGRRRAGQRLRTSPSGIQRIPFTCDGHPHTVTVEAFGRTAPPATGRSPCRWRRARRSRSRADAQPRVSRSSSVRAASLSRYSFQLPHFGDCTHDGHPARHGHAATSSAVACTCAVASA